MSKKYENHEMEVTLFEDSCWVAVVSGTARANDIKVYENAATEVDEDVFK